MTEGYSPTGYGQLSPEEAPTAPINYDLFGMDQRADEALSRRLADAAPLAHAALFPEHIGLTPNTEMRYAIASVGDYDHEKETAERKVLRDLIKRTEAKEGGTDA